MESQADGMSVMDCVLQLILQHICDAGIFERNGQRDICICTHTITFIEPENGSGPVKSLFDCFQDDIILINCCK